MDNKFPLTGNDLIDYNFRLIGYNFSRIEIVDVLPTAAESLYGQDRMFAGSNGDVPMICLKNGSLDGFTWTEYRGGVYNGAVGPLLFPVKEFKDLSDALEDPEVADIANKNFAEVFNNYQRRNMSPNLPAPEVYLRGWKWLHETGDGDKLVICCLDANSVPYWKGPITLRDDTPGPPDPENPDPDPDPDTGPLVVDRFEPADVAVWESNAEGQISVTASDTRAEGDTSMRVGKGVEIDDFDENRWTFTEGFGGVDTTNKVEGSGSLGLFPNYLDVITTEDGRQKFYISKTGLSWILPANTLNFKIDVKAPDTENFTVGKVFMSGLNSLGNYVQFSMNFTYPIPEWTIFTNLNLGGLVVVNTCYIEVQGPLPAGPSKTFSLRNLRACTLTDEVTLDYFSGGWVDLIVGDDSTLTYKYALALERSLDILDLSGCASIKLPLKSTCANVAMSMELTNETGVSFSKIFNFGTQVFTDMTWDISNVPDSSKNALTNADIAFTFNTDPEADQALWLDIMEAFPPDLGGADSLERTFSQEFDLDLYHYLDIWMKGKDTATAVLSFKVGGTWHNYTITPSGDTQVDGFWRNRIDIGDFSPGILSSVSEFKLSALLPEDGFPESFRVDYMNCPAPAGWVRSP